MDDETWTLERILQTSGSYWATCVLHTMVALDIFTRIGDGRQDVQALARQVNGPEDAIRRLLDAATAMGLLVKEKFGYCNTPASRTYLSARSEHYLGFIIQHHHHLMPSWARLPEAVASGKSIRQPIREKGYKERQAFLMGMFNLAMQLAPRLVPVVDLSACGTLLDLGGGPGTYAIHFCRQYPQLTATVIDLPTTRPFAEETIRRMGMAERIRFVAGDYLHEAIDGHYDAVWMSHILHGESPDNCQRIIQKAADCLNPGGLAVIHEFILNNDLAGPLFPTLFSLNMLLATQGGQAYSDAQLSAMLSQAGLEAVERIEFTGPNDSGLIRATKPA
ncbi:conserved hypothetical protein [Desulfosarcina cetonica]|nr:conserved hypothetical protein [Desulfosarcina cetonica]